jgi:putative two-component system hydrogenase maturation factor HypX/HoxX
MFGDRSGFAAARHNFVTKAQPVETPERLRLTPANVSRIAPKESRQPAVRPAVPLSA